MEDVKPDIQAQVKSPPQLEVQSRPQPLYRSLTKSGALGERLSAQSVALIIKSYAKASGLDERNLSGHSLRSGLVTSAARAGISSLDIRKQTGHKSDVMLSRYIREANLFVNNAAGIL